MAGARSQRRSAELIALLGKADLFDGTSLDGYIVDREGKFDWSAPSDEQHRVHNEQADGSGFREAVVADPEGARLSVSQLLAES